MLYWWEYKPDALAYAKVKIAFWKEFYKWKHIHLQAKTKDSPISYPSVIVCDAFEFETALCAAWVTFEQCDIHTLLPGGEWGGGTFRYQLWLLRHEQNNPNLLWEEVVTKCRCSQSPVSMRELACDVDRLVIERGCTWMRDLRKLEKEADRSYPDRWTKFTHPE